MSYVDFFCLPLEVNKESEYKEMAEVFATVMKEQGPLKYCEAVADDVPRGEVTDFYRAVEAKDGETVVSAFCTWPDKETRDRAWEVAMKDPRLADMKPENMPFDGKRMFWGGFRPIIEV